MSLWCDRIITGGILFLVLCTPFAFGSVHPWAYSTMEAVIFSLVIVWMAKVAILAREQGAGGRGQGAGGGRHFAIRNSKSAIPSPALPLALFIGLALFQLMPLPPSLLRILSPQTYEAYTQILPGWPERVPYADVIQGSEVRGQRSERREQGAGSKEKKAEGTGQRSEVGDQKSEGGEQGAESKEQGASVNSQFAIPNSQLSPTPPIWLPLSLAPSLTRTDLLKFAAYAALFFLILFYPYGESWERAGMHWSSISRLPPEQRFFRLLVFAILFTGLFVSAIGFVERFSWNGKILWSFVPYDWGQPMANGVGRASGPFINPDHFANYLSLIFPIALACALFRTSLVSKSSEHALRICCGFTAFLLFMGILLSLSRGGWIGTLLGIAVLLWLMPWRIKETLPAFITRRGVAAVRMSLVLVCSLLIVSLFLAGPGAREQVDARLGEAIMQDMGSGGRTAIWRDSPAMIKDFPLFGVGLGAWPELFLHYHGAPWSLQFYREAHNDYLQLITETGVVGFGLLAWFFFQGGRRLVQGLKKTSKKNLPIIAAIVAALGGMAFHEWLDFNLQIPANAFLFILLVALALRIVGSREQGARSKEQGAEGMEWWPEVGGQRSALSAQWSEVGEEGMETFRISNFEFCNFLSRLTPYASRCTTVVGAVALIVCALNQEQIPYPYNLREPDSVTDAKELILSHPTNAPYHLSLLHLMGNRASLARQFTELKAALWIEPTNPYYRDSYAATLLKMGKMDDRLREIARSISDSPDLQTHDYLSEESLPRLSEAEQSAVEEGFKQALGRDYREALNSLAGFYAKLGRYADQGTLYEQAALKESDTSKKTDLLINSGLAYLQAENAMNAKNAINAQNASGPEGGNQKSEVRSQRPEDEQRPGSGEQGVEKIRISNFEIRNGPRDHALNAERLFRNAITLNPPDPKAYQQLIMIFGARRDLAGAKEIVSQGINNGAPSLSLYLSLAEGAQKARSPEETKSALDSAKAEVEKSVKNGEDSYSLYFVLADGARRIGDRDQETAALLKALDSQPRSADALLRLAGLYLDKQNFDRAALYLNRIANINPDSADVYYRIAQAEEGRYHFAAAGAAYARALELAPQNDSYRQRYDSFRERLERNKLTDDGRPGTAGKTISAVK